MASAIALRSSLSRALAHRSVARSAILGPCTTSSSTKETHSEFQQPATRAALLQMLLSTYLVAVRLISRLSPPASEKLTTRPTAAVYKGTINDPTTFPPPSRSHGSYHWAFERLLSASLVPMTVAAYVTSGSNYPVVDGLLGISLVMHSHIGVCLCGLSLSIY